MQKLTAQEHELVNQKWTIFILIALRKKQKISYKKISQISQIPTSTLSIRLKELIKYKFVEKFVYGYKRMPHNVDYKITDFGIDYLNNLLPDNIL